ncbi:MAG: hypothetical protein NZ805_04735 [Armatimonadetes bacterium]|nr:hypothetical protein [Armatimonadota bacterium]MDW8027246.1 hypothetical protein [Armatimonadota bacterium]
MIAKRNLTIITLVAILLNHALSQEWNITAMVQKSGLSWEEAAAALLLAKVFDVDMTIIMSTRKEIGMPVFVIAPAVVIAKVGKKDIRKIVKMKSKGEGWGVIAQRLGIQPGAFNKQRVALNKLSDEDLIAAVWIQVLVESFGVPPSQIVMLKRKGLDWGDVIANLQVSNASQLPPEKVLAIWQEMGKDWSKVRSQLGVSPDWLPTIKAQESTFAPKVHSKGIGKIKREK